MWVNRGNELGTKALLVIGLAVAIIGGGIEEGVAMGWERYETSAEPTIYYAPGAWIG